MSELLTDGERAAVALAGQLWNQLCLVVPDGPTRTADLGELVVHIHAIQQAVLANAAARAYPNRYRLLGGTLTDAAKVDSSTNPCNDGPTTLAPSG